MAKSARPKVKRKPASKPASKPATKPAPKRRPAKPRKPAEETLPDLAGARDPKSPLTYREALFVELLFLNGFKPMEACTGAGYSPNSAKTFAYKLLERPRVAAAIEARHARMRGVARLTLDELLQGIETDIRNPLTPINERNRCRWIWWVMMGRPIANPEGAAAVEAASPKALRALERDDLIRSFNRRQLSRAEDTIIEAKPVKSKSHDNGSGGNGSQH